MENKYSEDVVTGVLNQLILEGAKSKNVFAVNIIFKKLKRKTTEDKNGKTYPKDTVTGVIQQLISERTKIIEIYGYRITFKREYLKNNKH